MQLLNEATAQLLVNQYNNEIGNFEKYQVGASFFSNKGLTNLSKLYQSQAKGELDHADILFQYLLAKNIQVANIQRVSSNASDILGILNSTLTLEMTTTQNLKTIANNALSNSDYETFEVVSPMLKEQTEEVDQANTILDRVQTCGENWHDLDMWVKEEFLG